jgi:hypothetical protein
MFKPSDEIKHNLAADYLRSADIRKLSFNDYLLLVNDVGKVARVYDVKKADRQGRKV